MKASDRLLAAVWTIIVADLVMSLDNVMGVAAATKGSGPLIGFGLLVSIPIVVVGSRIITRLITRFPIMVLAGGGLLGSIAGEIMIEDPAVAPWIATNASQIAGLAPGAGFALVVHWDGGSPTVIDGRTRRDAFRFTSRRACRAGATQRPRHGRCAGGPRLAAQRSVNSPPMGPTDILFPLLGKRSTGRRAP